jgi:protein-disulfide isomerase
MRIQRTIAAPLWLATVLSVAACAETPRAAESQVPADPDQVVAEVGGRKITLKEVDQKWEDFDSAERARLFQLLYQNRRTMLDQLVGDILIDQAAKSANLSADAYLAQETAKRSQPVTDADVQTFFDQNKDRAGGRSLNELRKPIEDFLQGQRKMQARAQLVDELRSANSSVRVMLEPPRYNVELAAHDPIRGNQSAPVTIVEFSDYQCPFCARVNPTIEKVRETYGNKVRIVFKDFPLANHAQAPKAAEAAHCAGDQGKYWEMHDRLFSDQRALEVPGLKASAAALGLNVAKFNQCLDSATYQAIVQEDLSLGEKMGVNSTPTLYINGRAVVGAQPFELFKSIIDEELAKR